MYFCIPLTRTRSITFDVFNICYKIINNGCVHASFPSKFMESSLSLKTYFIIFKLLNVQNLKVFYCYYLKQLLHLCPTCW